MSEITVTREELDLIATLAREARNCAAHALGIAESGIGMERLPPEGRVRLRYIAADADEVALHTNTIAERVAAIFAAHAPEEEVADEPTPEGP